MSPHGTVPSSALGYGLSSADAPGLVTRRALTAGKDHVVFLKSWKVTVFVLERCGKSILPSSPKRARHMLAPGQRVKHKDHTKAIRTKISKLRKHFLYKLRPQLVKEYVASLIGPLKTKGFAKKNMAKSVLKATWPMFNTPQHYKDDRAASWLRKVSEAYQRKHPVLLRSTAPKTLGELDVCRWACSALGTENRAGFCLLVAGIIPPSRR